jgi:hypothetical protein
MMMPLKHSLDRLLPMTLMRDLLAAVLPAPPQKSAQA